MYSMWESKIMIYIISTEHRNGRKLQPEHVANMATENCANINEK